MEYYTKAWKEIVCPLKFTYHIYELGAQSKIYSSCPVPIRREDFNFSNEKGNEIHASLFSHDSTKDLPCIIYLHSHSASRIEGLPILEHLNEQFSLCLIDFSGSGNSGGDFVTLGIKESDEIALTIKYLKQSYKYNNFFLWGRSMGAVASILYMNNHIDQSILGAVLDSPFLHSKEMVF